MVLMYQYCHMMILGQHLQYEESIYSEIFHLLVKYFSGPYSIFMTRLNHLHGLLGIVFAVAFAASSYGTYIKMAFKIDF